MLYVNMNNDKSNLVLVYRSYDEEKKTYLMVSEYKQPNA